MTFGFPALLWLLALLPLTGWLLWTAARRRVSSGRAAVRAAPAWSDRELCRN